MADFYQSVLTVLPRVARFFFEQYTKKRKYIPCDHKTYILFGHRKITKWQSLKTIGDKKFSILWPAKIFPNGIFGMKYEYIWQPWFCQCGETENKVSLAYLLA
jgi:hypothetical protein